MEIEIDVRQRFGEFVATDKRWSIAVCHRRAGKTVACIQKLIKCALECDKPRPRYAYIAPLLKQAKTVSWDYLKRFALAIPGTTAHESELRVDFPTGAQIRLYGADRPDSLRGIYLDGVVLDEAADMHPRLFSEILRPALSDRQGWAVWIGTPKGENSFYDLWKETGEEKNVDDWCRLMLRASETGYVPADELLDARRHMTDDQYSQEYECSFTAAIIGSYYSKEMQALEDQGRFIPRVYDKALEVHTAWDLGLSDQTVIWFYQQTGRDIWVCDYYANYDYGFEHYANVLRDKGYKYGRHFLPHDVQHKHETGGDLVKTRKQTLEGLGVGVSVVPKWTVEDGINAVRRVLPRCWFDTELCKEGVKALKHYRREWDDIRKVFRDKPLHDWASDPADAFRYLAISIQEPALKQNLAFAPKPKLRWVV